MLEVLIRAAGLLRRFLFCVHGVHRPFPMLVEGWVWDRCMDCGKKISTPTRLPWILTVIPPSDLLKR